MHNFRRIAFGFLASFLMIIPVISEQLAAPQKFHEVSGIVALAGYWENTTLKGFTLINQAGLPSRVTINTAESEGCWHILLTDVKGMTKEQAKFVSVVLGRRTMIHPIFLDYVQNKIPSGDESRPELFLCFKAPKEMPLKIGSKLTLKSVTLADTGGMHWSIKFEQMKLDAEPIE